VNYSRLSGCLGRVVLAVPPLFAIAAPVPAADDAPAALAHIRHIEDAILGPVLVKGVATSHPTLAKRMDDL
jgi:hypothetical protein